MVGRGDHEEALNKRVVLWTWLIRENRPILYEWCNEHGWERRIRARLIHTSRGVLSLVAAFTKKKKNASVLSFFLLASSASQLSWTRRKTQEHACFHLLVYRISPEVSAGMMARGSSWFMTSVSVLQLEVLFFSCSLSSAVSTEVFIYLFISVIFLVLFFYWRLFCPRFLPKVK